MEPIAAKSDGESDGDDSYFDLVFDSPHRAAGKKDSLRFVESPRDVLSNSSPATLLRSSSPKFKVFLRFSFRKSSASARCEKTLRAGDSSSKSAEIVAGDSTLRSQLTKEASDCEASPPRTTSSGDAVPKYLKLIRPLYQKVWKRRSGGKAKPAPPSPAPANFSPMSGFVRTGSFKISAKRLVKSRSASAAVGGPLPSACRKDDSLLEKHDGIQGAVLYCKKSFNSSSEEISQLFRTWSDPSREKPGRHSCELPAIRCSI